MKSLSDPRMLGAILNAPAFLSGLTEAEFNVVRRSQGPASGAGCA